MKDWKEQEKKEEENKNHILLANRFVFVSSASFKEDFLSTLYCSYSKTLLYRRETDYSVVLEMRFSTHTYTHCVGWIMSAFLWAYMNLYTIVGYIGLEHRLGLIDTWTVITFWI